MTIAASNEWHDTQQTIMGTGPECYEVVTAVRSVAGILLPRHLLTEAMMTPAFLPMIVFSLVLTNAPKDDSPDTSTVVQIENERVKALFESMRKGFFNDIEFLRLDLTDVPALLEHADSTQPLETYPTNPLSSQRQQQCTEGMMALWLIEGVRHGGQYPSLNPLCFKNGVQGKDWTKASEDNHKEVAQAYRNWWSKAKRLCPYDAKAIDPLKGTDLHWH